MISTKFHMEVSLGNCKFKSLASSKELMSFSLSECDDYIFHYIILFPWLLGSSKANLNTHSKNVTIFVFLKLIYEKVLSFTTYLLSGMVLSLEKLPL